MNQDPASAKHDDVAGTDAPAVHIGEAATRTGLSLRSLRHWEEVGLVRPSGRTDGGFRLYTEDDIERILVIRRMKPLGFTLDEMTSVMRDIEHLRTRTADAEEAVERLRAVEADAVQRRAKLVERLAMADEFIALLANELE